MLPESAAASRRTNAASSTRPSRYPRARRTVLASFRVNGMDLRYAHATHSGKSVTLDWQDFALRFAFAVLLLGVSAPAFAANSSSTPTCPEGARLVQLNGQFMCAWESDIQSTSSSSSDGASGQQCVDDGQSRCLRVRRR